MRLRSLFRRGDQRTGRRRHLRAAAAALIAFLTICTLAAQTAPLPELTQPVNDLANVIDPASAAEIDTMIRELKAASGDVVVVATIPDIDGYGDLAEYANRLFENGGKGIGDKGKDNGLLIVLALKERQVRVEVGYDLEQWVTDAFAGDTSRLVMAPRFREGNYGAGLRDGTARIIARIAQGRGVTLQNLPARQEPVRTDDTPLPMTVMMLIFFAILMISRIRRGPRRGLRRWGGGGWSGWSSGVGPFGGGFGGGGGGFGGGFGGFGGGRSGGGGGGAGW
jgi:uncharacterized protein